MFKTLAIATIGALAAFSGEALSVSHKQVFRSCTSGDECLDMDNCDWSSEGDQNAALYPHCSTSRRRCECRDCGIKVDQCNAFFQNVSDEDQQAENEAEQQ